MHSPQMGGVMSPGEGALRLKRRRSTRPSQGQSQAEVVYEALKREILSGTLAPGAPLREEQLALRRQVSRTPIRQALTRLEAEGLATRHQGSGLRVAGLAPEEIADLYVLREALEGLAARIAAHRASELDLARLQLVLDRAQDALPDADAGRVGKYNAEFHYLVWRIAGNKPLLRAITSVHESVQRVRYNPRTYADRFEQFVSEHGALLEAIRNRDPETAERLAIEHVRQVRNIRIALSLENYDDFDSGGLLD